MDFIELLDEDKASKERGDAGVDAGTEAEVGALVPAVPAKAASAATTASSAAIKTSKAKPAPATTQPGKKRANDDHSQAGGGPIKKIKPSTARAPKPKTPAPPKQVKSKVTTPEKAEKADNTSSKSSPAVRQKQALAVPPPQTSGEVSVATINTTATTIVHTMPPRDDRTSYPLSTPEIAEMGRTDVVSDPSSCDTSLTASTLLHPAMFTSEYLNFDFDFQDDHPHPQTESQIPLSSSDTSPSFHSAQHLGSAFQDGTCTAADAIHTHTHANDFNSFNSNTNVNSSSHGGNHDVMILEQLRTMNATLQGMHEMMKYQAQAQMSSTTSGGFDG